MGRYKKYMTQEQMDEANRIKARRYYERNKEKVKKKNLERYYNSVI